ncbi:MAG: right-handed parallel beta-helix repeat-containing protein [Methanomicrobiales archaeon]|nr:right-handed parallel beta-helix repeat-containing protein [Methanomicrobiales archaeon]
MDFPEVFIRGIASVFRITKMGGYAVILFIILGISIVQAGSIYVPDEVASIQGAVRMAQPGDTIYVYGGVYQERVIIDKSINLIGVTSNLSGETPNPPVIQIEPGSSVLNRPYPQTPVYAVIAPQLGPAVDIRADRVRVTDLVLVSSTNCVIIGNRSEVSIEGSLFAKCETGISGKGGSDLTVIGNRFQSPGRTGLDLMYTADTEIRGNFFSGGITGIRGENIQRWSIKDNIFQDLLVAFRGNGVSDSVILDNNLENCTTGYTFLSSRNNIIQSDRFQNLTQYLLLINSPSHQVTIRSGNNATTMSRGLASTVVYRTPWLTLSGENFAFSFVKPGTYPGYRFFGDRVRIISEADGPSDSVSIEAETFVRMWEDIDPFTFGIYRVDRDTPIFTGVTYVSGQDIRTSTNLNATDDGIYALLAKKKTPFGLTIEGVASIFLLIAVFVAMVLYRSRRLKKGPSRSRAHEFRNKDTR